MGLRCYILGHRPTECYLIVQSENPIFKGAVYQSTLDHIECNICKFVLPENTPIRKKTYHERKKSRRSWSQQLSSSVTNVRKYFHRHHRRHHQGSSQPLTHMDAHPEDRYPPDSQP